MTTWTFAQHQKYNSRITEENESVILKELNFEDRNSYLEWAKNWRMQLNEQIQEVRKCKGNRKSPDMYIRAQAQSDRQSWRIRGANLMALRKASKIKAGIQMNHSPRIEKEEVST